MTKTYVKGDIVWILYEPSNWTRKRTKRVKRTESLMAVVVGVLAQERYRIQWLKRSERLPKYKAFAGRNEYTVDLREDAITVAHTSIQSHEGRLQHFSALRLPFPDNAAFFRTAIQISSKNVEKIVGFDDKYQVSANCLDCVLCSKRVDSKCALFCHNCEGIRHYDCSKPDEVAWQQLDDTVQDRQRNILQCLGGGNRHPVVVCLPETPATPPTTIRFAIDIGTVRPRLKMQGSNDGEIVVLSESMSSAVWWYDGDGPMTGSQLPLAKAKATVVDPIKMAMMKGIDHPALKGSKWGVYDICLAFFRNLLNKGIIQGSSLVQASNQAQICLAVPAGMKRSLLTPVLTALYHAAEQAMLEFSLPFRPATATFLVEAEPKVAILGSKTSHHAQLKPHQRYICVLDIGGTTLCIASYETSPILEASEETRLPLGKCITARSLSFGLHRIAQELLDHLPHCQSRDTLIPAIKEAVVSPDPQDTFKQILRGVLGTDPELDDIGKKFQELRATQHASAKTFISEYMEVLKLHEIPQDQVYFAASGGGTIDEMLMDVIRELLPSIQSNKEKYSQYDSTECDGLLMLSALDDLHQVAPYHIAIASDFDDNPNHEEDGLIPVVKKGDALKSPILPHDQAKPGEPIIFDVTWCKDSPFTLKLLAWETDFAQTERSQHGYRMLAWPKEEDMWVIGQIDIHQPQSLAGSKAVASVTLYPNLQGKTMVVEIILALDRSELSRMSVLDHEDLSNSNTLPPNHKEIKVISLDTDNIDDERVLD
ncbi:hypothetical protein J1614_010722 [Plenodomus biglobosus]|nr:hypothetical protein J1614_010722 [Plenodomus biglobosus]